MFTNKQVTLLRQPTNQCKVCHARELCLSSCLDNDELKIFDKVVGHRAPLNRGERLFMAGDKIKSLFVLHSGSVKTYVESSDGDNQITDFHLPGDIIGIHGIENRLHTDTVEALETSSVCELYFNDIEDLTTAFPSIQSKLMGYIFKEMSHEQEMLLILGKMSAQRRLAYFLLDMSQRVSERGLSAKHIHLSMTRHDIANFLGLAVETVSRLLTKLQQTGVIDVHRRSLTIEKPNALGHIYDNSESDPQYSRRCNKTASAKPIVY